MTIISAEKKSTGGEKKKKKKVKLSESVFGLSAFCRVLKLFPAQPTPLFRVRGVSAILAVLSFVTAGAFLPPFWLKKKSKKRKTFIIWLKKYIYIYKFYYWSFLVTVGFLPFFMSSFATAGAFLPPLWLYKKEKRNDKLLLSGLKTNIYINCIIGLPCNCINQLGLLLSVWSP